MFSQSVVAGGDDASRLAKVNGGGSQKQQIEILHRRNVETDDELAHDAEEGIDEEDDGRDDDESPMVVLCERVKGRRLIRVERHRWQASKGFALNDVSCVGSGATILFSSSSAFDLRDGRMGTRWPLTWERTKLFFSLVKKS